MSCGHYQTATDIQMGWCPSCGASNRPYDAQAEAFRQRYTPEQTKTCPGTYGVRCGVRISEYQSCCENCMWR